MLTPKKIQNLTLDPLCCKSGFYAIFRIISVGNMNIKTTSLLKES